MIRTWSGAKIQNWFGFEMVEFRHLSSSGTVVRSLALDWWQYIGILAMFAIPWPAQVNEVLSASRRLSRYDAGLKMILKHAASTQQITRCKHAEDEFLCSPLTLFALNFENLHRVSFLLSPLFSLSVCP
jgi:hypothetical protein